MFPEGDWHNDEVKPASKRIQKWATEPEPASSPAISPSSAAATELSVEIVDSIERLAALSAEYETVLGTANNKLPFSLHDWHLAWCNNLLMVSGTVRDELRICVVRDMALAGACVAIVPMILTRRTLWGMSVRSLGLLGGDQAMTEIREPLVQPGYEESVALIMLRTLDELEGWDWVEWSGDGPFARTLAANAELQRLEPLPDFILDLPSSWDELRARLKRNIRESLRHCYNSLKRDGLDFQFKVVDEPADVAAAVDKFLVLHAKRAALSGTIAHPNHFATARSRAFLREVCARLAQRRTLRIFQLIIRGEVVASRIGFIVDDSLYLYYSGFDSEWARYSVMTTTVAEAIKYAIATGLRYVNLSPGRDASKLRWGPREVRFGRTRQVANRWRSRLALACYSRIRALDRMPALFEPLFGSAKRAWE
jgi:CelD/BcsL family acetyltransferase involved in cellulose biosynthesis